MNIIKRPPDERILMINPRSILITGASSGIGQALAFSYAREGRFLFLTGRHTKRLEETAAICRTKGAIANFKSIEITDTNEMYKWITEIGSTRTIDLVIANAGISLGSATSDVVETAEQINNIFYTNFNGTLNTILPALEHMRKHGEGQIALMSSMASFRGLPGATAYCSAKAAIRVFGEGLKISAADSGIDISVICPGYVKTPMTAENDFYMPFIMTPESAANRIKKGLAQKKSRVAFPKRMYFLLWFIQLLPIALMDMIISKLPRKKAGN
jgi:short-subunit dehydrogenase